jgi:hypothetical protein
LGAILIITVFLIFVASFALLRTKRSSSTRDTETLPPGVSARGLFGGEVGGYLDEGDSEAFDEDEAHEKIYAGALRARAEEGDLDALDDARATGDAAVYRFVLDALVGRSASSPEHLHALAAHIARSDGLRSSPALAEILLGEWRRAPTRASTAELLRVSALSDDASTFGLAVSEVLEFWEDGRLEGVSGEDLRSLFESEYWLLSSEAKRSGAGFVLKGKLADARRRAATRTRHQQTDTDTDADFNHEVPAQKERP